MSRFVLWRAAPGSPPWQGPRVAWWGDVERGLGVSVGLAERLVEAMFEREVVVFRYSGSDRVCAPFVLGVSSEGEVLCRCYQLWGDSVSGKGPGWRVFKVDQMSDVRGYWEYYDPSQFDFDWFYPWIYAVVGIVYDGGV